MSEIRILDEAILFNDDLIEPSPPRWQPATEEDRARAAQIPHSWDERRRISANAEEAWSERDDEYHPAKQKVNCPSCNRVNAPLISTRTRRLYGGWRWVGLDHREPYVEWLCVCPGCRIDYILTTYTPQ